MNRLNFVTDISICIVPTDWSKNILCRPLSTLLGKHQNLETQICKRAKSINDLTTFILMNSLIFVTTISICIVPAD